MIPRSVSLIAGYTGLILAAYYTLEGMRFWALLMLASAVASFATVFWPDSDD